MRGGQKSAELSEKLLPSGEGAATNEIEHEQRVQVHEERDPDLNLTDSSPSTGLRRRRDMTGDLGAAWKLKLASEESSRKFSIMLILSSTYLACELVFGVISGSLALMADAFHMISDVVAIFIGLWVARLTTRGKTSDMSFGWRRAEIVGAFANGCFLLAVCFTITLEAVEKLAGIGRDNEEDLEQNALVVLMVGGVGLLINLLGMCVFGGHGHSHGPGDGGHGHSHGGAKKAKKKESVNAEEHGHGGGGHGHSHAAEGHSHGHDHAEHGHGHGHDGHAAAENGHSHSHGHGHGHGHEEEEGGGCGGGVHEHERNLNEWSMYLHVMGDALGSAAVMGNAAIIHYWDSPYRFLADPISSLLIVLIILLGTVPLVLETAHILMEGAPPSISDEIDTAESLQRRIEAVDGVHEVHELHIWRLTQRTLLCTVHVVVKEEGTAEVMKIVDDIKALLHHNNIHSSTIQTEMLGPSAQIQQNASNCADPVCDDTGCIQNSCCGIEGQDEKENEGL